MTYKRVKYEPVKPKLISKNQWKISVKQSSSGWNQYSQKSINDKIDSYQEVPIPDNDISDHNISTAATPIKPLKNHITIKYIY